MTDTFRKGGMQRNQLSAGQRNWERDAESVRKSHKLLLSEGFKFLFYYSFCPSSTLVFCSSALMFPFFIFSVVSLSTLFFFPDFILLLLILIFALYLCFPFPYSKLCMVAYACNPSTQENLEFRITM